MSDWRDRFPADIQPYCNQFADLFKTAYMQLLWRNGPSGDPNEQISHAETTARELIAKYRHLGEGNPHNDHFYRCTDRVSSSGFYDGMDDEAHIPWATHTINLDETRTGPYSRTKHLWNGHIDDGGPRPYGWFEKAAYHFMGDFATNPEARIHVNCAAGASRAPSMAYFFVRATTKLPVLDAKATVYAANSVLNRNISITYWQDAERALRRLGLVDDAWFLG
jgi:hypothetical protein